MSDPDLPEAPTPLPDAPAPAQPRPSGARDAEACASELAQRFPALFGGAPKPLKLHIQADIQAHAPGVFGKAPLRECLRRHTGRTAYLLALTRASQRFGLDGEPAGELSDAHRQAAAEELARRRGLREQRERELQAQRRERAALLRDFESTRLSVGNFCALRGIPPQSLDALLALARREAADSAPDAQRNGPRSAPRWRR